LKLRAGAPAIAGSPARLLQTVRIGRLFGASDLESEQPGATIAALLGRGRPASVELGHVNVVGKPFVYKIRGPDRSD